ncbi:MAG: 2-phosphosulfolactate phosphatase [Bacteroidota bacterium]|nr:2-phosphosulfolactate phosphatase [Bacteroidota bacterium]MDP4191695.1 2-phosphosulfolactate phosphatase [Bacteroidota bacterium]MDP4194111.1 2-phosphosulfolactate phosphatase [Bacteroidota bacterium]
MKVNVHFSPLHSDELYFTAKTTVVIDVLRATTTVLAALHNGAKEVIPVNSVEFAMKVSVNSFGGQTLLGGERNTKKIEGFQLGNSPLEYSKEAVSGKSIILFTTNGSKAIVKAKFSETLLLCSFLNVKSVAAYLANLNKDIEILCAGKTGSFCIEDTICAGRLITELKNLKGEELELTDSSKASVILDNAYGNDLQKVLSECEHGKLLIENGFQEDVNYCAQVSVMDLLPSFNNGTVKPLKIP